MQDATGRRPTVRAGRGTDPGFAVVIPLYESAQLVTKALDSVRSQSLPPREVLVVDDGSTDGGGELVRERYPDIVVLRQTNQGLAAARNAGIGATRRPWVALLDADDVWLPHHLERLAAAVGAGPDCAMAMTACRETHIDRVDQARRSVRRRTRRPRQIDYLREQGRRRLRFCPSCVALRRDTWEAVGGFRDIEGAEDQDLWVRLALHHGVIHDPTPTVLYVHGVGGIVERRQSASRVRSDPTTGTTPASHVATVQAALASPECRIPRRSLEDYLDGHLVTRIRSELARSDVTTARHLRGHLRRPLSRTALPIQLYTRVPRWLLDVGFWVRQGVRGPSRYRPPATVRRRIASERFQVPEHPRCLLVIKGLQRGGAERIVIDQATDADATVQYEVVNTDGRRTELADDLEAAGIPVHHLGGWPPWPITLRRRLRRSPQVDVLHVHSPLPAAVIRLLRLTLPSRGPALVYTEHSAWAAYHPLTRLAHRLTLRLDDRRIAVSEDVRRRMGRAGRSTRTVRHGIRVSQIPPTDGAAAPTREDLGIAPAQPVIVVVAALRPAKDHPTLLHAVAQVRHRHDVQVLCVGDGTQRHHLSALCRELRLDDRVRFLGWREDVPALLRLADVACLSSRHEGLPLAIMEAQVVGRPVVATRAGGIGELVEDGVDGRLVPVGDACALAHALEEVLEDPGYARRARHRASTAAERYDRRRAQQQIEAILREAVAQR